LSEESRAAFGEDCGVSAEADRGEHVGHAQLRSVAHGQHRAGSRDVPADPTESSRGGGDERAMPQRRMLGRQVAARGDHDQLGLGCAPQGIAQIGEAGCGGRADVLGVERWVGVARNVPAPISTASAKTAPVSTGGAAARRMRPPPPGRARVGGEPHRAMGFRHPDG